jgi:hypothetical protein
LAPVQVLPSVRTRLWVSTPPARPLLLPAALPWALAPARLLPWVSVRLLVSKRAVLPPSALLPVRMSVSPSASMQVQLPVLLRVPL